MADNNVRQRRGKKSTSAATDSEVPSTTNNNDTKPTPSEQLKNAQARLIVSRDRTADLHTAWRAQLFRLSFLILFISVYQLQNSISSCITEIKGTYTTTTTTTGMEAIKLIFTDSFCELIGVVISSLLAYFLALSTTKPMELDHWSYMISSGLVPICLSFFFHVKSVGCYGGDIDTEKVEGDDKRHQFPAVVIYHTIVTLAFYFMKNGMKQCEDHVKLCTQSIEDFERMDKKIEQKKKLRNASKKK